MLGYSVYYQTTVGDNEERLLDAIKTAMNRAEIILISGGLGPTMDDITKEMVAKACGLELVEDMNARNHIKDYFAKRKIQTITDNNWKQALVPKGAKVVMNSNGTAPGIIVEMPGCRIFLMPGPPNELKVMMKQSMIPYLEELQDGVFYTSMVKISGLGESFVESELSDLIKEQTNPTIAPYAKEGEVHIRVTAKGKTRNEAKSLVEPVVKEMYHRFGDFIFTDKEEVTLEQSVVELLKKHRLTLCTVESCTGGLLAGRIINVGGVSDVFRQGFITYSNEAKMELVDVKQSTLEAHGAVSPETAKEMAQGATKRYQSKIAVSITGIAGPDGGSEEKPVGLVYIGYDIEGHVFAKEFHLTGNRSKIRETSVANALTVLRHALIEHYESGFSKGILDQKEKA